jgi:hypothetical protein
MKQLLSYVNFKQDQMKRYPDHIYYASSLQSGSANVPFFEEMSNKIKMTFKNYKKEMV